MFSDLGLFLFALWDHWQALVTGGLLAVFMMLVERARKKPLSWKVFAAIMAVALLWSCFAAWRDEHAELANLSAQERSETEIVKKEIGGLKGDLKAAQASNAEKDKRLGDLQFLLDQRPLHQRPPTITIQPPPPPVPTERAWLVAERVTAEFSSPPVLRINIDIRNTGQIPAFGIKSAGVLDTSPTAEEPDYNQLNRTSYNMEIGNGLSSLLTMGFPGFDAQRLQKLESGEIPFRVYFYIEYSDSRSGRREPLKTCRYWTADTKILNACKEPP